MYNLKIIESYLLNSVEKKKTLQLLRRMGSYLCPHFVLQRSAEEKKGCCGTSHEFDYFPTCTLVDGNCPGLTSCPRLNEESKKKYIERWRLDTLQKKVIKVAPLIRDIS